MVVDPETHSGPAGAAVLFQIPLIDIDADFAILILETCLIAPALDCQDLMKNAKPYERLTQEESSFALKVCGHAARVF